MKSTPADRKPLIKVLNYASVVGMLLYLAGHSRLDISHAVNCAVRYTFCPCQSHEVALKRIGRYSKLSWDKGLILKPTKGLSVNAYPDANFSGLYGIRMEQIQLVLVVGQVSPLLLLIVQCFGSPSFRPKLLCPQWRQR